MQAGEIPATSQPRRLRARPPTLWRLLVPGLFAALALAAGLQFEQHEGMRRCELAAARSENRALKVRQEVLRERLFEASRRLEALAPGTNPRPHLERRGAAPPRGREST